MKTTRTITVSTFSPKPIYAQIEEQLRAGILSGDIEPEKELPSIRALAQSLRVSVITVKRAYEDLEREGYVRTLPGRGTFARKPDIENFRIERLKALSKALSPIVDEAMGLGFSADDLARLVDELYRAREGERR